MAFVARDVAELLECDDRRYCDGSGVVMIMVALMGFAQSGAHGCAVSAAVSGVKLRVGTPLC